MKAAIACGVVLLATGLSAQQGTRSAQFRPLPPDASGCPVSFGAQVDSRLVVRTVDDKHRNPDSPLVRLTFGSGRAVLSASVVIHGTSRAALLLPVAQQASRELGEPFNVAPRAGSHFVAEQEVRLASISIVQWAEIRELRFADGSTWRPSADDRCKAVPSLFREVNLTAQ